MSLTHVMVIGANGCWAKELIVNDDEELAIKAARKAAYSPKVYNVWRCDAQAFVDEDRGSMMYHDRQLVRKVGPGVK